MRGRSACLAFCVACALAGAGASVSAQTPAPKPPPPRAPAVEPPPQPSAPAVQVKPEPPRQSVNVRVEVTITEQRGSAAPAKKIVSTVAGDGLLNRIRSSETFLPVPGSGMPNVGDVPLNIDVMPMILQDGKIRLTLNLEYDLPGTKGDGSERGYTAAKSSIRENLGIILENGKPLVVAQSADPVSDRQVSVEVRATILK
jgi:hypothetical protein